MKTKQIVGMVVATALFIGICLTSIVTRNYFGANKSTNNFVESFLGTEDDIIPEGDYVAVIDVEGTIQKGTTSGLFDETSSYDHVGTLEYIDEIIDDSNNKGILLYLDTPGGTIKESDELYLKLMEYKEKTGRKIYAYMDSMACSGGYYVAMSADYIMINRNGTTGSVGVIISYYDYSELCEKLGIKEESITSGKNKAMGSGTTPLTKEQRGIYQASVDEAYEQFVGIVETGRGLSEKEVKDLADGRIYTAKQALELKMVDNIVATYDEAQEYVLSQFSGDIEIYEPSYDFGGDWVSELFGMFKQSKTESSEIALLKELIQSSGNGVPMYYAK